MEGLPIMGRHRAQVCAGLLLCDSSGLVRDGSLRESPTRMGRHRAQVCAGLLQLHAAGSSGTSH